MAKDTLDKMEGENNEEQAESELCQAQHSLS